MATRERKDRNPRNPSAFGKWIKETRVEMGLTPAQAAARTLSPRTGQAISASAWNKIESSVTPNIYNVTVEMVCMALGVPVEQGRMIAYAQKASAILADYEMPPLSMAKYASLNEENKATVHDLIDILADRQRKGKIRLDLLKDANK
jgi:transcriptional regulator with XRE-family HTH domain